MDLKRLQQFGTLKGYRRGYILFKAGDLDPNMYLILKGVVSLRSKIGEIYKSQIMESGGFFGEISVILGIPKMDTCVIEEDDTTLLSIPRTHFEGFINEDTGFAMRIMRFLAEQSLEAMGEKENIAHRIRKYEPSQSAAEIQDMELPLTPDKKVQKQANTEEKQESNSSSNAIAEAPKSSTLPKQPEMLKSIEVLKGMGIALPEHGVYRSKEWPKAMGFISPKTIKCPVCGETFIATYFSRSKLGVAKTDADMRKRYAEIEPIYFDIYACSHCGYANFSEDFEKLRKDEKGLVQEVLQMIKEIPQDMSENILDINYIFLKLYLALLCNTAISENAIAVPKLWMRLSWLYDDEKEVELARLATEQSYKAYMNIFYNTKTFTGEAEKDVLLLMGELALKLGMEKEASNHFMAVLQAGVVSPVHRKKAEDRIYDIRHKDEMENKNKKQGN